MKVFTGKFKKVISHWKSNKNIDVFIVTKELTGDEVNRVTKEIGRVIQKMNHPSNEKISYSINVLFTDKFL